MTAITNCWIACDYTSGDHITDVRHSVGRDDYETAASECRVGDYEGVRWVGSDGYLYAEQPE